MAHSTTSRIVGAAAGAVLAPWFALGSFVRQARVFHPRGVVLWGNVSASASDDRWAALGARLEGCVLARFSGAWWKQRQWPDVLGCALRFTHARAPSVKPQQGDQDLLLATIRTPLTTMLAPLTTHVSDYLDNAYFGVAPFEAGALGRVKVRLSSKQTSPEFDTRTERIDAALAEGPIALVLEARAARLGAEYHPIARITLTARVDLDQEALHFDPYRTGRQLEPAGFVHALRLPIYAASRKARAGAPRATVAGLP